MAEAFFLKRSITNTGVSPRAATRVTTADARGLEVFLDEYPDLTDGALLLHGGALVEGNLNQSSLGRKNPSHPRISF